MRFFLNIQIIIQLISVLVPFLLSVFLFFHLLKSKKKAILNSYLVCNFLLFLWALSELLEALTINKSAKWLVIQFQFFPVCFIGICWLILCLYSTDHKLKNVWHKLRWLLMPPCLLYGLLLTNEYHHLYFTVFDYSREVFGIGFWLNLAVSYSYVLLGMIILFRFSFQKYHQAKLKFLLLSLVAFTPVLANILFVTKIVHITYNQTPIAYDITPNAFSLSATFITIIIFQFRFPNIWPLALGEIVHNFKESILVVDNDNDIVNYNLAFAETFLPSGRDIHFKTLANVIKYLKPRVFDQNILKTLEDTSPSKFSKELLIQNAGQDFYFSVNIQPVFSHQGEVVGRIISLYDVSSYKKLMNELNEKNEELQAMNEELLAMNQQLEEYSAAVEELTIKAERNRIARDSHDTLSNTMALLIKLLEASIISCDQKAPQTKTQIQDAIKVARGGLGELRRLMFGLVPERLEKGSLKDALEVLIADFLATGLKVDFATEGIADDYNPDCKYVLYKTCQEALTNSIRHGGAQNVTVILKRLSHRIRLIIIDDGCGCREIHKGFGLSSMEQRVKSLHGDIYFCSDGETGFQIKVEVPI
jgi:PAS domain S-box-containing protein